MDFRDLDFNSWRDLARGKAVEDLDNLTPLGRGAYGTTYEVPGDPSKVVKFQYGDQSVFKNEVDKLADAYFSENTDVPRIHESGWHFDPASINDDPDIDPIGSSYIVQDRRDFDGSLGSENPAKAQWRKSQALSRLYNQGVSHNDTHGGNIKYDSATDTPSVLDLGLATKSNRYYDHLNKAKVIRQGLKAAGDDDAARIFHGIFEDSYKNGDKFETADIIDQGQEVLEKSEFRPDLKSVYNDSNGVPSELPDGPSQADPVPYRTPRLIDDLKDIGKRFANDKFNSPSAAKIGLTFGLTDLIPSAEVVRTASDEGLQAGAKEFGKEALQGIPVGAGVGLVSSALPQVAPFMPGVAGGMMLSEGARTLNEATRALTGETGLSKFRQVIGTEERTGLSSPGNSLEEQLKRDVDLINNPPTITQGTRKKRSQVNDTPFPDFAHRLRLSRDRFNPAKGEFGISELIFGR